MEIIYIDGWLYLSCGGHIEMPICSLSENLDKVIQNDILQEKIYASYLELKYYQQIKGFQTKTLNT